MVADSGLITSDIKAVFCKSWYRKAGTSFKILLCVTKISTIKEYPMVSVNFDSSVSCFQMFMVSKLKRYTLDLRWGFVDTIIKATDKIAKRKMSLGKL